MHRERKLELARGARWWYEHPELPPDPTYGFRQLGFFTPSRICIKRQRENWSLLKVRDGGMSTPGATQAITSLAQAANTGGVVWYGTAIHPKCRCSNTAIFGGFSAKS